MNFVITVLAVLGFFAVARRLARALLHVLGRGVEAFVAEQETSVRERRGDLTGLREAEAKRRVAQRARRGALLGLVVWSALLLVPLLTPWTALVWAACAALWFLPAPRAA